MTDKYTLEEIEAATIKLSSNPSYDDVDEYMELLKAELTRPKPEFAEGQVINTGTGDGNWSYVRYESSLMDLHGRERHLTLTEHGPAVKALRDYVEMLATGANRFKEPGYIHTAKNALAAFDAAIET